MPDNSRSTGVLQRIHGDEARVAGGHYFEFRQAASASSLLETVPTEELDELTVDNERLFARRFGTDLPRDARAAVIAIKQNHGFVDSEVRWLVRSGFLRASRNDAKLKPTVWAPVIGWFMVLSLSAFCASSLLQILTSAAPAWTQAIGAASVLALGYCLGTLASRVFITPWRLVNGRPS